MSETTVRLVRGAVYFAGIARPWFASQSMIRSALADEGFAGLVFHDRASADTLPPSVTPEHAPSYSDDWDEWIEATYLGPDRSLTTERRWAWLLMREPAAASPGRPVTLPPVEPLPPAASEGRPLIWFGLAVGGLAAVFAAIGSARKVLSP